MSNDEITQLNDVATKQPKSRVTHKKEWYVSQLAIARMELHAVKCNNEKLVAMFDNPTIFQAVNLLVKAVTKEAMQKGTK